MDGEVDIGGMISLGVGAADGDTVGVADDADFEALGGIGFEDSGEAGDGFSGFLAEGGGAEGEGEIAGETEHAASGVEGENFGELGGDEMKGGFDIGGEGADFQTADAAEVFAIFIFEAGYKVVQFVVLGFEGAEGLIDTVVIGHGGGFFGEGGFAFVFGAFEGLLIGSAGHEELVVFILGYATHAEEGKGGKDGDG